MTVMVGLALAVALFQPTSTTTVVIGDIGSRAFVFRSVGLDQRRESRPVLRGWMCRRAPGASVQRLAVIAEDRAGAVIWKQVVAPPAFAPGRSGECRVLRIAVPPDIAPNAAVWRLARP